MVQPQPRRETLRALIARHAEQRAAAPAILAPGRALLNYGELKKQVERGGSSLASMGLGRGSRIAVSLADSADTAVTMLTAMSFAACAPLDPHLKLHAARELLERLRVDAVVVAENSDSPTCAAAREMQLQIVRLCPLPSEPAGVFSLRSESSRTSVEPGSPEPDEIALIMQTSGTTGRSKLVPITLAQVLWSGAQARFADTDRALCLSPLYTRSAFGISVMATLTAGASTIITGGFDAEAFVDWLDALRPTFYSASPTVHTAILDLLKTRRPATPHSLRFVRSSSRALPSRIEAQLEAAFGVPLVQGYGMTECGMIAQNPLPPGRQRAGSVGVSTGIQVSIRDERGERVPDGAPGEVTVRGPGVISAYEEDPEANRRAFCDGWFRTGDVGHIDADGYLFLTGRIKDLINRGGLKVSPVVVEEALLSHPSVLAAAAFSTPHASLGEDVAAAVVLRELGSVNMQALRDFAVQHLAPSNVPTTIVEVAQLPTNALGKVQRDVLRATLGASLAADFVPPRNYLEERVAAIFAQVLELQRVGAFDHFFSVGGDSLRGAQVLSRVEAEFGVHIEFSALFRASTVARFADALRAALEHEAPKVARAIQPLKRASGPASERRVSPARPATKR